MKKKTCIGLMGVTAAGSLSNVVLNTQSADRSRPACAPREEKKHHQGGDTAGGPVIKVKLSPSNRGYASQVDSPGILLPLRWGQRRSQDKHTPRRMKEEKGNESRAHSWVIVALAALVRVHCKHPHASLYLSL